MKSNLASRFSSKSFLAIGLVALLAGAGAPSIALAAALTNKSNTLSSQKINQASDHTIVFRTPSGADAAGETIVITFPAGFNLTGLAVADVALAHSADTSFGTTETLAASASASAWGVAFAGQTVTLTAPTDGIGSAALAANNYVRVVIGGTNKIVNPSSANNYAVSIAGTFGDAGSILVPILTDDQVQISARVDETLTFTISDNVIGFGSLSSGAARYATDDATGSGSETGAHDLVVGTNASNGYTLTVLGDTLTYGANDINAIGGTAAASAPGTEQFGMRYTSSGGSGTVAAPYNTADFAFVASTTDEIASATTVSANTTYSARYIANINATTPAGEYSTTLTYTATANF